MIKHETLLEILRIHHRIGTFSADLGEAMAFVVEQALPLVEADGVAIELAEGDDMICRAGAGILQPQLGVRTLLAGSLASRCMERGAPFRSSETKAELPSKVLVPLKNGSVTIGVLRCVSRRADAFGEVDSAVLELISSFLTASLLFTAQYNCDNLFYLATHDRMTGLANRSHFMDRLRHARHQHRRSQLAIAILFIDMDGLTVINERYGRDVGDAILREYASCLKSVVRQSDTVARVGGDEFAVILNPVDPVGGVDIAIKRIQEETVSPLLHDSQMYLLRASIGAAYFPGDANDIDELLGLAELRMIAAKNERQQSKSIFQPLADL